jgi:hypothetical protein
MTTNDGGPAFPRDDYHNGVEGMSLRQYAAIHLCVPDSGEPWLDDMIRQAQRDRLSGQALAGLVAGGNHLQGGPESVNSTENAVQVAYRAAVAMLSARKGD